jgi:DNA-binding transcriptional ArsR family regulator
MNTQSAARTDRVFHAIADANRRKILELLAARERPVQDLVAPLGITVGAVSQHLRILHDSGLVTRRKAGRQRFYRAVADAIDPVTDWAARYRRFWEGQFDQLEKFIDSR